MDWISIVDFGLVVLIWMVQLVVYPSFKYYAVSELLKWHRVYTSAIATIVLPLMLAQLILHAWRLYSEVSLQNICVMLLVLSTWLVTCLVFVPLHHKVAANHDFERTLSRLVTYNWLRTVLWSVIFVWGLAA